LTRSSSAEEEEKGKGKESLARLLSCSGSAADRHAGATRSRPHPCCPTKEGREEGGEEGTPADLVYHGTGRCFLRRPRALVAGHRKREGEGRFAHAALALHLYGVYDASMTLLSRKEGEREENDLLSSSARGGRPAGCPSLFCPAQGKEKKKTVAGTWCPE